MRLRSDVERKRLAGLAPLEQSSGHRALDLYTPNVTQRTYARLAQLAALVVRAGFTAIVDAAFLQRAQRDAFRRLAEQLDARAPSSIFAPTQRRCGAEWPSVVPTPTMPRRRTWRYYRDNWPHRNP